MLCHMLNVQQVLDAERADFPDSAIALVSAMSTPDVVTVVYTVDRPKHTEVRIAASYRNGNGVSGIVNKVAK